MLLALKELSKRDSEECTEREIEASEGEGIRTGIERGSGEQIEPESNPNQDNANENPHIAPNWLDNKTINNKIRTARLNFFGHVIRSNSGGILKTALEYKIPAPKKRGKPAYSWRNCIWQDIERSGIPLEEWHETATDKTKMKLATKSLYNTMVESEYEMSDESEGSNSDGSLLPSEFDGFSDDEADFAGFSD